MSSHQDKKMKTEECDDATEYEAVKAYVSQCPVQSEWAVTAALKGLEQEYRRRQRDARLKAKFTQQQQQEKESTDYDVDAVKVEKTDAFAAAETAVAERALTAEQDVNMSTDDWQDVEDTTAPAAALAAAEAEESSALGARLAKEAIAMTAANDVKVATPVAAIAVALHAALLQSGFVCTGLPDPPTQSGFAPAIRPLSADKFLPNNWDAKPESIQIRYRKEGTGSVVLTVTAVEGDTLQVALNRISSNSTTEPLPQPLMFPVSDHVNLESFSRAAATQKVHPALHYKALAALMTQFVQTFDLGHVEDEELMKDPVQPPPPVDPVHTKASFPGAPKGLVPPVPPQPQPVAPWGDASVFPAHPSEPGFPGVPLRQGGDFADDLNPVGIPPVHPGGGMGGLGGSQMGPTHPIFGGGPPQPEQPTPGFTGMPRPRFDPYGPPGGPTEIDDDMTHPHPSHPQQPGGPGDPNPDHQPVPGFRSGSGSSNSNRRGGRGSGSGSMNNMFL
jgi:hypothetical protein